MRRAGVTATRPPQPFQYSAKASHPLPADLHALLAHAPLWLLDRRKRGQMRTGSNRRHGGPLPRLDRCMKLTKNEGPGGGAPASSNSCAPATTFRESRPGERFRSAPATTQDVPLPDETEASP